MRRASRSSARGRSLFGRVGLLFVLVLLLVLAPLSTSPERDPTPPAEAAARATTDRAYARLPLAFERNEGQADAAVRFLARGRGYGLFLLADEAVIVLGEQSPSEPNPLDAAASASIPSSGSAHWSSSSGPPPAPGPSVIHLQLVGAASESASVAVEELPGTVNYFRGADPSAWRTGLPTYGRVRYEEVYPGIDVEYYGSDGQLEYDFVIAPGADPQQILLRITGPDALTIDEEGNLVLGLDGHELRQPAPRVYQDFGGARVPVDGSYVIWDPEHVGFALADYDPGQPLVIDPVLTYSTFLRGTGTGQAIAVDTAGSAYITGTTQASDFPVRNAFQPTFAGGYSDAFVAKLTPDGAALAYATYLGGSGFDFEYGKAIAVDAAGSAYVTGWTSSLDFPTTPGAFDRTCSSGGPHCDNNNDGFVAKLTPTGGLAYSTYLGDSGPDGGTGIAVDASGNAYVVGQGIGEGLTVPNHACSCGYLLKLNADGSDVLFASFLGGDIPTGVALDSSNNVYVAASNMVRKVNAAGTAVVYTTTLGGCHLEAIAVDASSSVYVTGWADTATCTTKNALQATFMGGGRDAMVAKLDPAGAIVYSTYLGSSGWDYGSGIAVDSAGNVYLCGTVGAPDFPTRDSIQPMPSMFVTKLNATGSALVYSTFFGGINGGGAGGIALDGSGNAYLVGSGGGAAFPLQNPLYTSGGAFVTKISEAPVSADLTVSLTASPSVGVAGTDLTFTVDVTNQGAATAQGVRMAD